MSYDVIVTSAGAWHVTTTTVGRFAGVIKTARGCLSQLATRLTSRATTAHRRPAAGCVMPNFISFWSRAERSRLTPLSAELRNVQTYLPKRLTPRSACSPAFLVQTSRSGCSCLLRVLRPFAFDTSHGCPFIHARIKARTVGNADCIRRLLISYVVLAVHIIKRRH